MHYIIRRFSFSCFLVFPFSGVGVWNAGVQHRRYRLSPQAKNTSRPQGVPKDPSAGHGTRDKSDHSADHARHGISMCARGRPLPAFVTASVISRCIGSGAMGQTWPKFSRLTIGTVRPVGR